MENTSKLNTSSKVALFVGAHPDDIELGAGGTAALLAQQSWSVWFLILTSEHDEKVAQTRKSEAVKAAERLSIPSDQVLFADLPDAHLVCNGKSVAAVRNLLVTNSLEPDIILTHTAADSHKDHREAHELVVASVRRSAILGFGVVNSLVRSDGHAGSFAPRVYVDVGRFYNRKVEALACHVSQKARIDLERVNKLCNEHGETIGAEFSEAFDLLVQEDTSPQQLALAMGLNDSPFHRFWLPLISERKLVIIHAVPVWRRSREFWWPSDGDRVGISRLYRTFNDVWHGRVPIEDHSCEGTAIERLLDSNDILLSGGAVSNHITRGYYNHFSNIRYVVDYTMPDYSDTRIADRSGQTTIRAKYSRPNVHGTRSVVSDVGILTIMPNPMCTDRVLIGCMGIHSFGSLACFLSLSDSRLLRDLTKLVRLPLQKTGYQVLIDYDVREEYATIRPSSFHVFELEGL